MERDFPRCVQCLESLDVVSGLMGAFKALLDRPLTCPSCGRQMSRAEAQTMADKFGACVVRFHHELQRAVDILPVRKADDAHRDLMQAASSSRPASRVHDREELYRLVVRHVRPALRHEAQGHRCPMEVEMLHLGNRNGAIKIRVTQEGKAMEELLLIVRIGADDYLLQEAQQERRESTHMVPAAIPAKGSLRVDRSSGAIGV